MPKRDDLPWHVRVHDHVYIWAGGDFVRRMHFTFYVLLVHGQPVSSDLLAAQDWVDRESFEKSCEEHEDQEIRKATLYLPHRQLILRK